MSKSKELSICYRAPNPGIASYIKALLEAEGIRAFVDGASLPFPGIPLNMFGSTAECAGCNVLVAAGDLERAERILEETRKESLEDIPDEEEEEN